jgi:hypothetical protein
MPDRIRSGQRAHKLAEAHVQALTNAGQELAGDPRLARMIDSLGRGIPIRWSYDDHVRFDRQTLSQVGDLMGEIAVCDMWKRNGRIAYDINEELAAALYRSKQDSIPGSLFDQLPHINPMVVLPDPWPVSSPLSKTQGWVRGWFVFGWVGTALCDTNDPQREGLGVLVFYDVVNEETGELEIGPNRMLLPLPTGRSKFTVAEAIEFIEEWQGVPDEAQDLAVSRKILGPLLAPIFSVMTYLCCDNRDVENFEASHHNTYRKKTGKNRKPRDPFWIRVGWFVGTALHENRQRALVGKDGPSLPSGAEYGPQHRAGHFKTVHYGPGRQQSTTKWVEPYWTKREMLEPGQNPVTQIVPVNPQRHDPLRRRDMRK